MDNKEVTFLWKGYRDALSADMSVALVNLETLDEGYLKELKELRRIALAVVISVPGSTTDIVSFIADVPYDSLRENVEEVIISLENTAVECLLTVAKYQYSQLDKGSLH